MPIPAQNIECENTMRSGGDLIEGCGINPSNVVTHHQIVYALFFSLTRVGLNIFHLKVGVFVLHKNYLRPILNVGLCVVFIQEIVSVLIINFDEGDTKRVLVLGGLCSEL